MLTDKMPTFHAAVSFVKSNRPRNALSFSQSSTTSLHPEPVQSSPICTLKKKLLGLSPRANYTDRATAACRWSDCQLLRIEGVTWSAWRIPTAVFSVFYTGPATFLSSSSSVVLTRLSGPRSRPTTFFSGSAGNRTRASGSVAKNSDH
jgi:hypothetical protein